MEQASSVMRLLEFADSTFPVGTFSFSNALESAVVEGVVHDVDTLESFTKAVADQSSFTDGVASQIAYRAVLGEDYERLLAADRQVDMLKLNAESRLMLTRMGKKMAELSIHIFDNGMMNRWSKDIAEGNAPGTYPIAQAITFAACHITAFDLFCAQQYGVMNMVLSAVLRCMKVSHFDTQRILFKLSSNVMDDFVVVSQMDFEEMNAFVPEVDILSSIHEKGKMRMFMS